MIKVNIEFSRWKPNKIILWLESEVGRREGNVKFLGDDGMLGMEYKERKIRVYNTEGNVMELLSTKEQVQEAIDFLEECKKEMK